MKSTLIVLLIAFLVAAINFLLDVPNYIYIILIISTIISLIFSIIKDVNRKRA